MANNFMLIPTPMINQLAITEIVKCNEVTSRYGLVLSEAEAKELTETRAIALNNYGRIEFAGGIINKLIMNFCDSPFISQFNYVSTLNDLIETFYYFKNETLDEISDDALISYMKQYFNRNCQGSVELLQNRELEALARNIRYGIPDYEDIDDIYEDMKNFFLEEQYNE